MSELDHHDAVWKDFVFVARFSLAYPKMVCPIAEREILVKLGSLSLDSPCLCEVRFRLLKKEALLIILKYRFVTSLQ